MESLLNIKRENRSLDYLKQYLFECGFDESKIDNMTDTELHEAVEEIEKERFGK